MKDLKRRFARIRNLMTTTSGDRRAVTTSGDGRAVTDGNDPLDER